MAKQHITLESMFREMDTWIDCKKHFEQAAASGLHTGNNKRLASLVKGWGNGLYDEDPNYVVDELVRILREK